MNLKSDCIVGFEKTLLLLWAISIIVWYSDYELYMGAQFMLIGDTKSMKILSFEHFNLRILLSCFLAVTVL